MSRRTLTEAGPTRPSRFRWLPAICAPTAALLLGTMSVPPGSERQALLGAAIVAAVMALFTLQSVRPVGVTILLNLAAVIWIWTVVQSNTATTPGLHLAQALLIIVPTMLFALRVLEVSGAVDLRRATLAAGRIRHRTEWPADHLQIRALPEVQALRAASRTQPGPALALLSEEWPPIRLAALTALEGRLSYRGSETRLILNQFQNATEPAIRSAVLEVLGGSDDRTLIDTLSRAFEDPAQEVRRTAARTLILDRPGRWGWVREHVHAALANPTFSNDGPLLPSGGLPAASVLDVIGWIAEGGSLAGRATLSLAAHYRSALESASDPELIADLRKQVVDDHTPAMLRVELAQLLHSQQLLDDDALLVLLEPTAPTPLRLMAAETLLKSKQYQRAAEGALRDIGQQPNRELAVVTASVVQRCLGVDMGLMLGQPLPELHTRQAVEVARRVMDWANRAVASTEETRESPPVAPDSGSSGVRLW